MKKNVRFSNGNLKLTLAEIKNHDIFVNPRGFKFIVIDGCKFEINDIRVDSTRAIPINW